MRIPQTVGIVLWKHIIFEKNSLLTYEHQNKNIEGYIAEVR